MRSRSEMFRFQVRAAERILEAPTHRLAVLLEPGYGKTVSALTALTEMHEWPALVVAPPRVARHVWPAEAQEWEHLRHLKITPITERLRKREGKKLVLADVVDQLNEDSHIETISYENLFWLSEHVDLDSRYRAIVFDELSKMKAPGTVRFRRVRARGMKIPVRIGLTGDPVPNHLLDLWGEMFMVAEDKPLGPTFTDFRDRYFESTDWMGRVFELKHDIACNHVGMPGDCCSMSRAAEREIHERVRPFAYVLPPQPEVRVPPLVVNPVRVPVPSVAQRHMEELEAQLWTMLESGTELEALSRSAVAVKLRQLASGAVYVTNQVFEGALDERADLFPKSPWEWVHDAKLDALDEVLDELQGQPAIVFYWFRHEEQRIVERLRRAGRRFAVGASEANMREWNRGALEVLLLHPASAGHGLNLQHGGHTVIWFNLPWSHELWMQGNRRVARLGQRAPVVNGHVITCGRVEERVADVVAAKGKVERRLMEALAA